jgi:uncharacterized membrane protein
MKKWKPILGACCLFILGACAGTLVTLRMTHRAPARDSEAWGRVIVRQLSLRLALDASQREQVRTIVREGQQELREVNRQVQPRMRGVFDRAQERVRSILRPDQQEKFDRLIRGRASLQSKS